MSDTSFSDNLSAVDRMYATHAQVGDVDGDGHVDVPHIDVENENKDGDPVDLENVGVPTGAESQARVDETGEEVEPGEELTPDPAAQANPDVEPPIEEVDPDDLTEEQLEAATAPEGEQA